MKKDLEQPVNCLFCGKPTRSREYIINPGAKPELPCCSQECLEGVKNFIDWDNKVRNPFYLILFVLVVFNLVIFGYKLQAQWTYLPLLGIGLAVFFFPTIFARYERYRALGIKKTQKVIRIIAVGLVLFSTALTISNVISI